MTRELVYTGVPSRKELQSSPGIPKKERLSKGPVATIECLQEIPCNVCESACPFNAIDIRGSPRIPHLNEARCIGCGTCIPQCPGMAIFLVDMTYSATHALISVPHEFLPLPQVDVETDVVNRQGKTVCKGKVVVVKTREENDKTAVVSLAVLREYAEESRGIQREAYVNG
jgi:Fe-S-cluster-containing hydrogenase component 2